jgi:GYF domain 2
MGRIIRRGEIEALVRRQQWRARMSVEWFYMRSSQIVGPLTALQLREHALAGKVTPSDHVRRGGDGNWVGASKVKGLFDTPAPAPSTPIPVVSQTIKAAPTSHAEPESNPHLVSCPDCGKSVSKKASQCPHCGCPLSNVERKPQVVTRQPEVFDIVFRCVVQAVRDIGYAVQGMDKRNGMVAFKTGISWSSFGQDIQLVVVDQGDSTCSIDLTNSFQGLTDWGEGKRIGQKIVQRARKLLHAEELPNALRQA